MKDQVTFYGPVNIYVRKEGREWWAYVDPFGTAGDGPTREKAVRSACRNLSALFTALAETFQKHGKRTQVLCPLENDVKKGADLIQARVVETRA